MKPTQGTASVGGHNVVRDGGRVRSLIGVVPQENNLDRYLTARENLVLHAKMHRMSPSDYNRRIDELLSLLNLADRQKDFPPKLSGGMQRRLVVARALVHDPRILFLDEPTTGLDPQAKRLIWDYFLSLKGKRTLFLTTHNMEEADSSATRSPSSTTALPDILLAFFEGQVFPRPTILPFHADDARAYGRMKAELERRGRPRFEPDLQIAAIALRRRLTVVTGNVRHFEGIPGLRVENWLA